MKIIDFLKQQGVNIPEELDDSAVYFGADAKYYDGWNDCHERWANIGVSGTKNLISKEHFEANMLDGQKVNDCGKALLSAESVWEYISEFGKPQENMGKEREVLSIKEIDKVLAPIPSTAYPIYNIDGKNYFYMCKEDISKAIHARLNETKERPVNQSLNQ